MECKCNWTEAILAIVIIVFAFVRSASAKWVVIVAAVLLLIHSLTCKKCKMSYEGTSAKKKKYYYSKKGKRG
ncbi:MAG: hypothetical protein AABY16_00485 [Nanoarchaeota archaeon]